MLKAKGSVPESSMGSKDVVEFYSQMESLGIKVWIDGGWCVDALLGKQLRPHEDLDIAIQWQDVPRLRETLAAQGYNQIKEDSQWNFVLADDKKRKIDVHAFVFDGKGKVIEGIMYPAESLLGLGTIDNHTVRCISPEYMVEFLAPWIYKWSEKYLPAVSALCQKYKLELPKEYKDWQVLHQ